MHPGNDPYLVWARTHYGWMMDDWMRGLDAGELALVVRYFIRNRWIATRRASYAYEVAWVLRRDRGTIGNVLRNLDAERVVEKVLSVQGNRRAFYRPIRDDIQESESARDTRLVDEMLSDFAKMHDENCPCAKMVDRW
jgi:hypothetical protein